MGKRLFEAMKQAPCPEAAPVELSGGFASTTKGLGRKAERKRGKQTAILCRKGGTKKRRIYSDVFLLNYIPLFRTRLAGKGDEWGNWIRGKGRKQGRLKREFRGKESASDFAFAFLAFRLFIGAAFGDLLGVFGLWSCRIAAFGIGQIGADGIL